MIGDGQFTWLMVLQYFVICRALSFFLHSNIARIDVVMTPMIMNQFRKKEDNLTKGMGLKNKNNGNTLPNSLDILYTLCKPSKFLASF